MKNPDILAAICDTKREHVKMRKSLAPLADIRTRCEQQNPPRGFVAALDRAAASGHFGVVCEIKKASPSHGIIREDFDPAQLAKDYAAGGASCLSVLSDTPYFQGNDVYIALAKNACNLPVLRKDFMLDPYQIYESRALGADCILLIMAALEDDIARDLGQCAQDMGMDILIESHDLHEIERAQRILDGGLIGINNRDLKTLEISLQNTVRLSQYVDAHRQIVSESGIQTHQDLQMLHQTCKIERFLVGERLMRERDVTKATHELLQGQQL